MRRLLPVVVFPPTVLITLGLCLYLLIATPIGKARANLQAGQVNLPQNRFSFYAVLPAVLGFQNSIFFNQDARPHMLDEFIKKYNPDSPLLPYTYFMVETADRYQLPFTLLVAIAMQESHLCRTIPYESNNCWGLGVYGDRVWRFATYEEAIDALGRTLSRYQSNGRVQPQEIMQLYTPKSDGSWARAVQKFMDEMQEGK